MYLFGFTINTLTLLAMVLAIGLVVDDAIVVLENIHRHMEEGMRGWRRRCVGTREIAFAVIAMTVTLPRCTRRSRSRPAAPGGCSSSSRWHWPARCWCPGSWR